MGLYQRFDPPTQAGWAPRTLDMRAVVNAIFYVVDGGIKWRMLPHEYPKWPSVYWYFRQWRDSGDWQRLHDTLRARVRQQRAATSTPPRGVWTAKASKPPNWAGSAATIAAKR